MCFAGTWTPPTCCVIVTWHGCPTGYACLAFTTPSWPTAATPRPWRAGASLTSVRRSFSAVSANCNDWLWKISFLSSSSSSFLFLNNKTGVGILLISMFFEICKWQFLGSADSLDRTRQKRMIAMPLIRLGFAHVTQPTQFQTTTGCGTSGHVNYMQAGDFSFVSLITVKEQFTVVGK